MNDTGKKFPNEAQEKIERRTVAIKQYSSAPAVYRVQTRRVALDSRNIPFYRGALNANIMVYRKLLSIFSGTIDGIANFVVLPTPKLL